MEQKVANIAAFVRDRLDEDEQAARTATPGPWRHNPGKQWFTDSDKLRAARRGVPQSGGEEFVGAGPTDATIGVAATGPTDHPQSMADAAHIARHDPARVLAQVAALRAVVDRYERAGTSRLTTPDEIGALVLCVLELAGIWSDHPDYDPAWSG